MPSVTDPRALVAAAAARLEAAGVASPVNDAEILLAHVLGIRRGDLILATGLGAADAARFEELVGRRARRIPLQHLTGTTGFRYVDLAVGPGVFTPRPETELLAGWALDRAREVVERVPVVVDLCTGSGAIAASVAHELPGAARCAPLTGPSASAPTTSRRTASPTTAPATRPTTSTRSSTGICSPSSTRAWRPTSRREIGRAHV